VSPQLKGESDDRRIDDEHSRAVALYYDAWQNKRGDFSDVPLADDFEFTGPVASFDSAEGYRAMAREAGAAVTSFDVRRQFRRQHRLLDRRLGDGAAGPRPHDRG
jgi:hypothetical protein